MSLRKLEIQDFFNFLIFYFFYQIIILEVFTGPVKVSRAVHTLTKCQKTLRKPGGPKHKELIQVFSLMLLNALFVDSILLE